MTKSEANAKAKRQSLNKSNIGVNRVCSFRSEVNNQYYAKGTYYTQEIGLDRSFNIGGKSDIVSYINGTKMV